MKPVVVLLLCVGVLLPSWAAAAITLTGADGQTLVLAQPATRIVSLAPDLTELAYDVGAGGALVGVSRYSNYPAAAKKLPRIGDAFHFDLERIVALRPDLVLAWQGGTPEAAITRLRKLKLPVLVVGTHQLPDIAANLELIGRATGHAAEAHAAAEAFLTGLEKLRTEYAQRTPVRVFYEISTQPLFTLGGRQIVSRMIELCGGRNIFSDITQPAAAISVEAVLSRNPQAIVTGASPGAEARLKAWQRWPQLAAVRNGSLFIISGDLLTLATPRMLGGGLSLCRDLSQVRGRSPG